MRLVRPTASRITTEGEANHGLMLPIVRKFTRRLEGLSVEFWAPERERSELILSRR